MGVSFSARTLRGKEVGPDYFLWSQDSFTVKSLPESAQSLGGLFTVHYRMFLVDYPNVYLAEKSQFFTVKVRDPCSENSSLNYCQAQRFRYDSMPTWMTNLQDQVITFGKDQTLDLGKPVDNFDREIPLEL